MDKSNKVLSLLLAICIALGSAAVGVGCGPKPARVLVVRLEAVPQEVTPGQDVTVSAKMTNIGDLEGVCDAVLRVDGEVIQMKSVTVLPSQSQTVHFTVSHDVPGVHKVEVNGIICKFTVDMPMEPATFSVSDLSVSPVDVGLGEFVTISLTVLNTGSASGSYLVILKINGAEERNRNIALDGGESEEVSFYVSEYAAGDYSVDINGLTGQFSVTTIPLEVEVDASKVIGTLDSSLWANVGYGSLYGVTVNEQLQPFWEQVRQTRPFRYVRCHDLYSDGISRGWQGDVQALLADDDIPIEKVGTSTTSSVYYGCRIYSEDINGNPKLDFWHIDYVLDIYLSAGVRPIIECDYMPDALAEGKPVREYCGGLINTPDDYDKWRELVYQTVKHCIRRYGAAEVRTWYWECWEEPDLYNYFIDGVPSGASVSLERMERYLKIYDYFAEGAKAADPDVMVGGPAIADHPEFLSLFLGHCATGTNSATGNTGSPLDFISWHSYGSLSTILERNRIRQDIIEHFPQFEDLPQLVDEWGRRGMEYARYTSYEATFLCKLLDGVLDEPGRQLDLLLRWSKIIVPDFRTGYKPLYFKVSGQIIPYPIMNAYSMLAKMGNESLEAMVSSYASSIGCFASRTDNGIQILIYRFMDEYAGNGQMANVELQVKGLSDTSYSLKHYRIDTEHSNATTIWEDMGQPDTLSTDELAQLEADSQLQLLDGPSQISTKDGQVNIRLNLPYNAISLIVLGEEFMPTFKPGGHVALVLEYEKMYKSAQQKLDSGDTEGAREELEVLIRECVPNGFSTSGPNPDCFWGQKALFTLGKLEDKSGNYDTADRIWQRLLSTTLNDTDRLILLQARLRYLKSTGKTVELDSVQKELQAVKSRLEVFANWSVWSDE